MIRRLAVAAAAGALVFATAVDASAQVPVTVPAGTFTSVSLGGLHACAVRTDATLACWGTNTFAPGASVAPPGTFRSVSAGNENSCGLRTDGTLACWGDDTYGQSRPPAGGFTAVSAGNIFACAIRADASLACWGSVAPPPAGSFTSLSAGVNFACALRADSTIACWGDNRKGQSTPPAGTFRSVSAAPATLDGYACAVSTAATLACWGANRWVSSTPPPGSAFTTVSGGTVHACAIKADTTLTCWGYNVDGEATPPAGSFAAVSAGYHGTCAIRTDHTLACWPAAPGTQPAPIPAARALSLPSSKRCVSRRRFAIHIRKLPGVTWVSAIVKVRGRRVKTVRRARLAAPVNLTGLPKGTFNVSITATAGDGRTATGTRTYHTCVRRHRSSGPKL